MLVNPPKKSHFHFNLPCWSLPRMKIACRGSYLNCKTRMIILEQSLFWLFFFCLEKNLYLRKMSQHIASQLCSHFSQSFILTKTPHAAVIGTTSRVLSASWELLPFSWKLLHRWTLSLPSRHPHCPHPNCSPSPACPHPSSWLPPNPHRNTRAVLPLHKMLAAS